MLLILNETSDGPERKQDSEGETTWPLRSDTVSSQYIRTAGEVQMPETLRLGFPVTSCTSPVEYLTVSAQYLVVSAIVVIAIFFLSTTDAAHHLAVAQDTKRVIADPPTASILRPRPGIPTLDASAPTVGGEAILDLNIQYSDAKIFNPGTGQFDAVKLRSYRDAHETTPPKIPFVAPTIQIFPGETVRITLHNKLPAEPACAPANQDPDIPNCFNRTNLHSHGVWINPTGNGDNVFLNINPGVSFQYEYNVSPNHPAGTFWYHPHRHGSTALQVSSGMAGVLVVKGTRPPTPEATGDIDTLLRNADGSPFAVRLILLQQIQYACRDANGKIKTDPNGTWVCAPGDIGGIEGYDQFGPGSWPQSGRYTSINGEVLPTFDNAIAGRVERWRLVHAGVRDTIKFQFRKMREDAQPFALAATATQDEWIRQNCPGEPLVQFAAATDGLTRTQIAQRTVSVLQPGYREDLLMVFPEAGDYCIIDDQAPPSTTVNNQAKSRKLLGRVAVTAGQAAVPPDIKSYLQAELVAAAGQLPADVRQKVQDELRNDLHLRSFVPHADIKDADVTGTQSLIFNINVNKNPPEFMIDGKRYDPLRIDRFLMLGGVDQWLLTSNFVGHPFHIHVNPFQIIRIMDPSGKDVSVTGEPNDPQYANLKGAWRDTLFVKQNYIIVMRTRYERYIGDFVLHCHILDHEDQGMMQNIRIAVPDGLGGIAANHH